MLLLLLGCSGGCVRQSAGDGERVSRFSTVTFSRLTVAGFFFFCMRRKGRENWHERDWILGGTYYVYLRAAKLHNKLQSVSCLYPLDLFSSSSALKLGKVQYNEQDTLSKSVQLRILVNSYVRIITILYAIYRQI